MGKQKPKKTSAVKSQKIKTAGKHRTTKKIEIVPPMQSSPKPAIGSHKKMPKLSTQLHEWLAMHARHLSFFGGIAVVSLWTLLRHISNGINFDVVGQLGVAQQWTHGQMSGTELGATSYLLKIPIYFLINAFAFLSPMNHILLAAILFNVMTFILLFIIYEKIMKLYGIKQSSWLYVAMAWLATITGNVFWADYANSRNLETVGGIFFIYLVLKYLKDNRLKTLLVLSITGSIVFFADPIQLYVCGLGVSLFVLGQLIYKPSKHRLMTALAIIGTVAIGFAVSRALFFLARKILHITFLATPGTYPKIDFGYLVDVLHGLVTNTLKIFGADFLNRPYSFNSIRELINAVILILVVGGLVRLFINKRKNTAFSLVSIVILVNYFVYAASGQVLQWQTSRYLVMIPLLVIILLITRCDELTGKYKLKYQYTWWLLVATSSLILLGALAFNWPTRHSKDTHIQSLISFMDQREFKYALSSRETGITTTYFGQSKITVLPMSCESDHMLHPTNLFYDKAAFSGIYNYRHNIPIIIPAGGIKFGPNTCTTNNIFGQFGAPKKILDIPDVGEAAVYSPSRILLADFGHITGRFTPVGTKKTVLPSIGADVSPVDTIAKLEGCSNGTVDIVVAHPDDDILFMNPDLSDEILTKCVRSIFVTAGDGGRSQDYWINRQRGIEAAYASIIGASNDWTDETAVIDNHNFIVRTLNGHPNLNLVFLRLPDGGPDGKGFAATGNSSLEKILTDKTVDIQAVDGSSSYTYPELVKLVGTIIATDMPNKILTHAGDGPLSLGDHSDHRAVGLLTTQSRSIAKSGATLIKYVGYPLNGLPANLTPEISEQKRKTFDIYASEDAVICSSTNGCSIEATYGKYFSRSYTTDNLK